MLLLIFHLSQAGSESVLCSAASASIEFKESEKETGKRERRKVVGGRSCPETALWTTGNILPAGGEHYEYAVGVVSILGLDRRHVG